MPIGFSKVRIGIPRVGINCAMCHTASYRVRPGDAPIIVPGAPSHQTAPQQYLRFLMLAAADPRFTAGTILEEISKNTRLSRLDRLVYRFAIIPGTRRALRRLGSGDAWMWERPDWGRGRIDAFNPVKYTILNQPIDTTIGHADTMPLWNLKQHTGYSLLWDGLNNNPQEVVLSWAFGAGASKKLGGPRLFPVEQHPARGCLEPAARPEFHHQRAAAGLPVSDRPRARRRRRGDLPARLRVVSCRRRQPDRHGHPGG